MISKLIWRLGRGRNLADRADFGTSSLFSRPKKVDMKMDELTYDVVLADSRKAFSASVSAVQPSNLIQRSVQVKGNTLTVQGADFQLHKPCHIVGFGKAVLEMALCMEKKLGKLMDVGVISVPVGTCATHSIPATSRIEVLEGALNNLPDEMAEQNAARILSLVRNLKANDTLIVLISGGGSALLPSPLPPLTLQEKLKVIKLLANAGADIIQLNCVRKCLSSVKGGRLSAAAQPATVLSLILSDVIGDPIDFIASGPTSPNLDTPSAAWDIICHFNLQDQIPESAKLCLISNNYEPNVTASHVKNILIGNNMVAIDAARREMESLNYSVSVLSNRIEGNVADVAKFYAQLALQLCKALLDGEGDPLQGLEKQQELFSGIHDALSQAVLQMRHTKGICLLAGGETTVKVTGHGKGGRNQELALRFAQQFKDLVSGLEYMKQFTVSLLSAGTDGIDGPTKAAGAVGYAEQLVGRDDYVKYLCDNDSNTFYTQLNGGKNLIVTGHTGTNVMDVHILVVQRRS